MDFKTLGKWVRKEICRAYWKNNWRSCFKLPTIGNRTDYKTTYKAHQSLQICQVLKDVEIKTIFSLVQANTLSL